MRHIKDIHELCSPEHAKVVLQLQHLMLILQAYKMSCLVNGEPAGYVSYPNLGFVGLQGTNVHRTSLAQNVQSCFCMQQGSEPVQTPIAPEKRVSAIGSFAL